MGTQILPRGFVPQQGTLWGGCEYIDNEGFLRDQLLTYLGNKRTLVGGINNAICRIKLELGKKKVRCLDMFSGSGIVARLLKAHASYLIANDLESYSSITNECYLANRSEVDTSLLREIISDLNFKVDRTTFPMGFIEELYAPADEKNITREDRVFYTKQNAKRIDNYRRLIYTTPPGTHDFLLAPLLCEASIHTNTSGMFKGFHKNKNTKIGQFGGTNGDALKRIKGCITLPMPIFSDFECQYEVLQKDANVLAREVHDIDIAYLDPPYNQHPYGSNYFMLNLIADYKRPKMLSRISGIPKDWNRSGYNVKKRSLTLMTELVRDIDAKFLIVSFNNEGFITFDEMMELLSKKGIVEVVNFCYNAFRGCKSFRNRPIHVTEYLFLVKRK